MKSSTSRRLFLQKSALATTGMALLSSGIANAFTSENPYHGYNPYSEEKTDLRTTIFEKHIRVKGIIYDTTGTIPLEGVTLEVWHLSPNSTKYRHRARLTTNEAGEYNFITDVPNREIGKVRKIYFKVTGDQKTLFTELVIHEHTCHITSQHWMEHQQLGEKLIPTAEQKGTTTVANFNISI